MTLASARKWLAVYFLFVTVSIGTFLLLFSNTPVLPLTSDDASACFQILIPVLVGEVTIIFKWISLADQNSAAAQALSPIPAWAIKLPASLALLIVAFAVIVLAISNRPEIHWAFSPSTFKNTITFAVTVLNASTVFMVTRLFPANEG